MGRLGAAKQCLIKFVQGNIDLHDVVVFLLNEVADDQVEFAAVGQGEACPADEITGLLQIQLQSQGKGNGGLLGGLVIQIAADLGKVLLGEIGLLVDFRILFPGLLKPASVCFKSSARLKRLGFALGTGG